MPSRLLTALAVSVLFSAGVSSLHAQTPSLEITGAYANGFVQGDYRRTLRYEGWMASIALRVTPRIQLAADVIGEYRADRYPSAFEDRFSNYAVLAGPKFAPSHGTVRPYFKILGGVLRTNFSTFVTRGYGQSFINQTVVLEPGAGVDVTLSRHFAWRIEGDLMASPDLIASIAYPYTRAATGLTYRY